MNDNFVIVFFDRGMTERLNKPCGFCLTASTYKQAVDTVLCKDHLIDWDIYINEV